jgi:predicted HD phosphohydrolase|tara:strand:+ start:267 stop:890 length:624 start_codon:yes stop_codon:yes gene_type:complete
MKQVKFTQLKNGDEESFRFLLAHDAKYANKVGERLIELLAELDDSFSAFQVTRLEHILQTTTRAWYDGADDDWVVTALLHDIGDMHAPFNHGDYAATVLAPFVREQCTWTTRVHGDFQMIYFPDNLGVNNRARDKHAGHRYFEDCEAFCERWDQPSFDPAYQSLPLSQFEPLVLKVFAREPFDPSVIRPNAREPLICKSMAGWRCKS